MTESECESRPPLDWEAPWPLGYPESIHSVGTVAAPLLALASFTLIGLIVPKAERLRFPSITLCFLVSAALVFVAAVQLLFWSRQWTIVPDDVHRWLPKADDNKALRVQRAHLHAFHLWSRAFVFVYRIGILLLLAGITFSLVPDKDIDFARWVAIGIASSGFVFETLWIAAIWVLVGTPDVLYYRDQQDIPRRKVNWLRRRKLLRRLARKLVPLVRLNLPRPIERAATTNGSGGRSD